jgi:hypothetical protein
MKKWFFLFLLSSSLFAEKPIGYVAFKPAYFYPQSKVFRHIYSGGFTALGEIGFYLTKNFFLSAEGGYFHKNGKIHSFDITSNSSVTQIPLTLYVGYMYSLKSYWDIYGKIGPNLIHTKTMVHIPNRKVEEKKFSYGASLSIGTKFYVYKGLFTEIFTNYLYNQRKIKNNGDHFSVHLGGWQFGGAIGYRF